MGCLRNKHLFLHEVLESCPEFFYTRDGKDGSILFFFPLLFSVPLKYLEEIKDIWKIPANKFSDWLKMSSVWKLSECISIPVYFLIVKRDTGWLVCYTLRANLSFMIKSKSEDWIWISFTLHPWCWVQDLILSRRSDLGLVQEYLSATNQGKLDWPIFQSTLNIWSTLSLEYLFIIIIIIIKKRKKNVGFWWLVWFPYFLILWSVIKECYSVNEGSVLVHMKQIREHNPSSKCLV